MALISDHKRISAVVGAAGTGKTTTRAAVRAAWEEEHGVGSVIGVAPSAKAAHVLGDSLGITGHTVDRFLMFHQGWGKSRISELRDKAALADLKAVTARSLKGKAALLTRAGQHRAEADLLESSFTLKPGSLLIVDEASMTSTAHLAHLSDLVEQAGAKMVMVGDPGQLDAVAAGGMLGWLDRTGKSVELSSIWRFKNPWEAKASMGLRRGELEALGTYDQAERIHSGLDEVMLEQAFQQTFAELASGGQSLLIAATNDVVSDVNMRFTHALRVAGKVDTSKQIALSGQMNAALGDTILTRMNEAKIKDDAGRQVFNGDLLTVLDIHRGTITARNQATGGTITLPADYVATNVQLGYSTTVHRCQGVTVDRARLVLPSTENLTRELLYVAMTRGRETNEAFVGVMDEVTAKEMNLPIDQVPSAYKRLAQALAAEGAERTAHEKIILERDRLHSLELLSAEYEYLASLESADKFTTWAKDYFPDWQVQEMARSEGFDALCGAWREAMSLDPQRTARVCTLPITGEASVLVDPDTPNTDFAKVLHWRLDSTILNHATAADKANAGWIGGLVAPVVSDNPTIQALADQCAALIDGAGVRHRKQIEAGQFTWLDQLGPRPDENADPHLYQSWSAAALQVAMYREKWAVDAADALGPRPFETNLKKDRAWQQAHQAMTTWASAPTQQQLAERAAELEEPQLPAGLEELDPYADLPFFEDPPLGEDGELEAGTEDPGEPASLPTPPDQAGPRQYSDYQGRLIEANTAAWQWWQEQATTPGDWTTQYLKDRGLTDVTPALAPAGWTGLYNKLRGDGFSDQELLDAGLITTSRRGTMIDRFRDRLPIPVTDEQDNIIAFTARINPNETNDQIPKYINSPATEIYAKKQELQGLTSDAAIALAEGADPLIVEGAMDSAAINQAAPGSVVPFAPCGTALTKEQLATLRSVAGRNLVGIRFGYDHDAAGIKATRRAWGLLTPIEAATADVVTWPTGADPAQLIQDGHGEAVRVAIYSSRPMSEALIDNILAEAELEFIDQRVQVARTIAQLTGPLPARYRDQAQHYLGLQMPDLDHETLETLFSETAITEVNNSLPIEQILRGGHFQASKPEMGL